MKINCMIVDDEPLSQEIMADYVRACPELELKAVCSDALEAGEALKNSGIQVLFLDINMPRLSGIGFVKSLSEPPLVIFVTAYPQYAVEGFEVDALDYLLKPVSFERFRVAVNRAIERLSVKGENKPAHLVLRADKKDYRVAFDQIRCLEARGDYVRFVLENQALLVHGRLKDFLAQLPENEFVQVHKSWVVSLARIKYLEGNQLVLSDRKIPVSLKFKEILLRSLGL